MNKMSIKELSENYGTHDLLTAYIMRTANINEDAANDILYNIDMELERWIEDILENTDNYEEE